MTRRPIAREPMTRSLFRFALWGLIVGLLPLPQRFFTAGLGAEVGDLLACLALLPIGAIALAAHYPSRGRCALGTILLGVMFLLGRQLYRDPQPWNWAIDSLPTLITPTFAGGVTMCGFLGMAAASISRRWRAIVGTDAAARCPSCDYLMTGLPTSTCPECGRVTTSAPILATAR